MATRRKVISGLAIALAVTIAGCDDDTRLIEATREADQRQAAQNQLVAEQSQQVAEATRRLVEADAQARQELLKAQSGLDRQRNEIEAERKELATQRHHDPLIAGAITAAAVLLACLLPVVLAIYVARGLGQRRCDEDALAELLIQEIVSEQPILLAPAASGHPRLSGDPPASVPAA